PGTNLIHAVAKDAQGNAGKESRAVVAGPTTATNMQVPTAITATISAQTFNAIARGTSTYLTTGDLEAVIAPHNPVLDLGGGPDAIVSMLHLDTAMGPILGWATEKFVVPMLNKSLAGLNDTKTVNVLGTLVDIDIAPASISFSPMGGIVELDTKMVAH